MNRTMRTLVTSAVALFVALVGLSSVAKADDVKINELTEGVLPTVQVLSGGVDVTGSRVQVLPDSNSEYFHFKLLINNPGSGDLAYADLFDDFIGGTLSDRLIVYFDPQAPANGGLDVSLCSDPTFCSGKFTYHYPYDAVETGGWQHLGDAFNTGIGDGGYTFYVASDITPEPATLTLMGLGLLGLARGLRRKAS